MAKKSACLYHHNKKWKEWPDNDNPHPDKDKILNYLWSGALYGETSYRNPDTGEWEGVSIQTDGEWEWDDLLMLYVKCKNVKIPDSFLQHMKDNNWEVPVPMNTFRLTLFDSHAIIGDSKNSILIDTGAPSTIHSSDSLFFCDENYSCSTNYAGITVEKLSELLGMKITTLLGVDILSNYNVTLDYKGNVAKFCKRNNVIFDGKEYSLSSINGIPIIELEIEQQPVKLFLDTGAKISYLPKEYTSSFETVGIEQDFHPSFGIFQTECFDIKATFGNNQFNVKFGNLPDSLQTTLMVSGVSGIIGYDFFNNFKILLDLKNNKMNYETYKRI